MRLEDSIELADELIWELLSKLKGSKDLGQTKKLMDCAVEATQCLTALVQLYALLVPQQQEGGE